MCICNSWKCTTKGGQTIFLLKRIIPHEGFLQVQLIYLIDLSDLKTPLDFMDSPKLNAKKMHSLDEENIEYALGNREI